MSFASQFIDGDDGCQDGEGGDSNEEEYVASICALMSRAALSVEKKVHLSEERFSSMVKRFLSGGSRLLDKNVSRLRLSVNAMIGAGKMFVTKKESILEKALLRYAAVNPLNVLEKGYTAVTKNGKRIVSVHDLSVEDEVIIRAKDGTAKALIKELKNEV